MPNTFITPSVIGREALMLLESNMVAANLVFRDHQTVFTGAKVGDTISIRRPATFTADEYDGATLTVQDATESTVPLVLEKHFDVSFEVSQKEMTLNIEAFNEQLLAPAMLAIAEAVDSYVLSQFNKFGSVAPDNLDPQAAPSSIATVANLREVMTSGKIPQPWNGIVSPTYETSLLSIASFVEADKRGDEGTALREASLGRVMGMNWFMGQNVDTATVTPGRDTEGTQPVTDAAYSKGATSIGYDTGGANTEVKTGDRIQFADGTMYSVKTGASAGATGTIVLEEPLRADVADGSTIFIVGGAGAGGDTYNVQGGLFHPNAIALAVVPLELPLSAQNASYVQDRGMGLRIVYDYDKDKKSDVVSVDILVGSDMIDGNLGAALVQDVA